MSRSTIAYFVTPHGFGHASRSAAVMETLGRRDREVTFEIVTTVPEWFFSQSLSVSHRIRPLRSDIGLVQSDPLREDLPATIAALESFWSRLDHTVTGLVDEWRLAPPRAVVSDISPLGLEVASRLGVPSVLVENFTWDFIYDAYLDEAPELEEFALRSAELTAKATVHVQCDPLCRAVETARTVSPVSRTPRATRSETRRRVGLAETDPRKLALLTMGGMGWGPRVPDLDDDVFLVTLGGGDELSRGGSLLRLPDRSPIFPPDLVWAAEVVIGKLGYSTVAECFRAGTRLAYVGRTIFPESPILERFVRRNIPSVGLTTGELETQDWKQKIADLMALPRAPEQQQNGAHKIADLLQSLVA